MLPMMSSSHFLSSMRSGTRKVLLKRCWSHHSKSNPIKKVVVVGGGTMGSGISQLFAQSGIHVTVIDSDDYAQKCVVRIRKTLQTLSEDKFPNEPRAAAKFINDVFNCLETTQSWEKGMKDADLVIEAVIESLAVKQDLFRKIDKLAPAHAILTSNTSSLSIEELSEVRVLI